MSGDGPDPLGESGGGSSPLANSSSTGLEANWVSPERWVGALEELSDEERAEAVPLYVLDCPLVPGSSHEVNVYEEDVGLAQMYDDLLLSGGRRIITTMGIREASDGSASIAEYGCSMTLESIKDARESTAGRLKWRCQHQLGRDRVRVDKVVARGAGDASYLRCVATEVRDELTEVALDSTVVVREGKHSGVVGVVEGVVNGWIRLRTDDGEVLSSRGRASVDVLRPPPSRATSGGDAPPAQRRPKETRDDEPTLATAAGEAVATVLAELEAKRSDLQDLIRALQGGAKKGAPPVAAPLVLDQSGAPPKEQKVLDVLADIAALQRDCDEDVRFNEAAVSLLGASVGTGIGTLWHLADSCWLSYLDQRAATRKKRLHGDLHERLLEYLKESGKLDDDDDDVLVVDQPDTVALRLQELPSDLRNMLTTLEKRVVDDLEPIAASKCLLQSLLDASSHDDRCDAFVDVLRTERARLQAKAALKKLFAPPPSLLSTLDTVPLPLPGRDDDDPTP